jgi:orotate phosphoribosyltransferase
MVNNTVQQMLIDAQAIRFGDFTLASGKKSSVYIDIKQAMTEPDILKAVAESIANLDIDWDIAAGVAVGGVPLAVAASLQTKKPYIIIRKEKKEHGLSSVIIGAIKGKKALMIEDVTTSGGSALYGVEQIREAGGNIDTIISVVDRDEGAIETLANAGIRLIPLIRMNDIVPK